jgi:hypothetical protein
MFINGCGIRGISARAAAMLLAAAGSLVLVVFSTPVSAQEWEVPRTAHGHPDLQGFWNNGSFTPLERPVALADREFYTEEEYAEIVAARIDRSFQQTEPGTTSDVHYDFAQFGLTGGQDGFVPNLRTSLIVDPPDGRIPAMTPEGEALQAARAAERSQRGAMTDRVANMSNMTRCIIWGADPPMLPIGYNSHLHIVQGSDHVMILVEMMQDVRLIPLDDTPHLPEHVRQWKGSSRGWWEGDTLVVETQNLTDRTAFRGASENLRVTERFTRVSEDRLIYEFTVEDPTVWVQPWSGEIPMMATNGPIFEFACHEHNYGVTNTLAGARAEEAAQRAAEEGSR